MASVIFIVILLALAVVAVVVGKKLKATPPSKTDPYGRGVTTYDNSYRYAYGAAGVFGVIALLTLFLSCTVIVPTKTVGVVTSFSQPKGTLDNGLHFKAPWEQVHEMNAAIQTDTDEYTVRLANGSIATVDSSIRWRIVPESADDLYRDYKEFDNVRDSLVTRQLNAALNEVFATYDPLASLASDSNTDQGELVEALGAEVQERLSEKIDAQIEVLDVLTPRADFDQSTEDKIAQFQQELANTRIATQKKATAEQEARANEIISNSVSNDPNVLVSKCLDLIKAGVELPAGFNCWDGGGSAVVIPGTK